jgi:hypothetical protein
MPLKYTTLEALNLRLDGRLKIGGNATTLGETAIAPELPLRIAEQIEARIDAILRKRYVLPLSGTHPNLAAIVESGVACQLFSLYYVAQTPSGEAPSDPGICVDYRRMLKELDGIALPGESLKAAEINDLAFRRTESHAGVRNAPSVAVNW